MKTRALGFLLMTAAAGVYAVGCGSSNNNNGTDGAGAGGTGGTGTGGKATGGAGGAGTGGVAGAGTGGKDAATDMATDTRVDGNTAPTFTQVFAIISDKSTATSPSCTICHDGAAGATTLPRSMAFTTKAAAYAALVNVNSIRCAGGGDAGADGGDAGAALKRVLPGDAAESVLVQKLMQGMGVTTGLCDTAAPGMPLNRSQPIDGGAIDGGDAGVTRTTYMVTAQQLTIIEGWISAGAQDN
jgi:hypothetical protein